MAQGQRGGGRELVDVGRVTVDARRREVDDAGGVVAAPLPDLVNLTALKTRLYEEYRIEVPMILWNGKKHDITAYVIFDIEVTDPDGYEEYKKLAPPTIAMYGGKYIVRGGKAEVLEGNWLPERMVVLEFENGEQAKAWLNSPEYSQARSMRHKYAETNMIVVEGI